MANKTPPKSKDSDWQIKNLDTAHIPRYTVIEGPIGVGKTTLTKKLAYAFNGETLLEKAEENPFLDRFYTERGTGAALPTQLFFLFQRVKQMNDVRQNDMFEPMRIADFLIEKDRLFAQITLDDNEFMLYQQVYDHLTINPPRPDLVIYLQAPVEVLLRRIKNRGIEAEKTIDANYLQTLNNAYAHFFHQYDASPLLIVNAADIDWANNPQDFQQLVTQMLKVKSGRHYFNPQPTIL